MAGLNPSIDYTAPLADRGTYNTAAPSTLTDPPGMDGGKYCIYTLCLSVEHTIQFLPVFSIYIHSLFVCIHLLTTVSLCMHDH